MHDHIRDALIKDAHERTEEDIETMLEFLLHFPVSKVILLRSKEFQSLTYFSYT